MDRRAFIATVAGLLAAPLAGDAQQAGSVAHLGVLLLGALDRNFEGFRQGLRELGHIEGQNLLIHYRSAEGNAARLAELAADLVRLKPNVIFALGGDGAPFVIIRTRLRRCPSS